MPESNSPRRPMFFNGEALKTSVERPPSGGGEKYEPQTAMEARALLLPKIRDVRRTLSRTPELLKVKGRVFIEASLLPNYLAPSLFPGGLLDHIGAVPVGSRAASGLYVTAAKSKPAVTRQLILALPDGALEKLETLVDRLGSSRSERSAFEEIRKLSSISLSADSARSHFHGIVEGNDDEQILWEAVLHPMDLRGERLLAADDTILSKWAAAVESVGGVVENEFVRQVGGLTFVPVRARREGVETLLDFNALRVVRPMPSIRPRPLFGLRNVDTWAPPSAAPPRNDAFRVAVFDGGLDTAANSTGHIIADAHDLTPEASDDRLLWHGTGVTAAALYGLVHAGQQAKTPSVPVDSFRILPAPYSEEDLHGYWVLDQIKDVISAGEHRIVNLSLGPALAVQEDSEPNRWTSELDMLAWERDVLFVVAAGNDGHLDADTGKHRVQVPADMVNGFAVGACDVPNPQLPWKRSSYSSIGPGRWGSRVQPIGVQFGGGESQRYPVLKADGGFLEATGTSFAAPLVTHAMSELAINLPKVNTNVLRAFGAHFAERPRTRHKMLQPEVGYGRLPADYLEVLTCSPDETHVLFTDKVERGSLSGYKLPVPTGLNGKLEFRLTLAYLSPVEPTEVTEYTQASVDISFRPHAHRHTFTNPNDKNDTQVHDRRSPEALALITSRWKESQEPVTKALAPGGGRNEAALRESGKWETLRHYRFSLDASDVEDPRIELNYLTRGKGQLDKTPSTLPFALLMSVADTTAAGKLYDMSVSQFQVLQQANVQQAGRARSSMSVRSGGSTSIWE